MKRTVADQPNGRESLANLALCLLHKSGREQEQPNDYCRSKPMVAASLGGRKAASVKDCHTRAQRSL